MKCRDLSEMDAAVFGGGSDPYITFGTLSPKFMELPRKKGKVSERSE